VVAVEVGYAISCEEQLWDGVAAIQTFADAGFVGFYERELRGKLE
jgi:hypothetical protein